VFAVGFLALVGNELRLMLHDAGMMLAPATFLGALAVGLIASLGGQRLNEPRITLTVPGIITMVRGIYAFQTVVFFNQGQMLEALQAAVMVDFVVGAMAVIIATGLTFGTVLTLGVVPVLYAVLFRVKAPDAAVSA